MDELDTDQSGSENTEGSTQNPIEQKALEMGWRPKDEFNGAEEDFIDAKEFVSRRPLFDKIEGQSRELKAVRKALEAFKTHYTTVQQTEYQRALGDLKAARKSAMQEGDGDRFEAIESQIKDVEAKAAIIKTAHEAPLVQDVPVHPEVESFMRRNPWYDADPQMRQFADRFGAALAATGTSPTEVLSEVETAVKNKFPDKFRNPNKSSAPDVGSSRQSSTGNKSSGFELSEQEKIIMNTLVRGGHLTKEKYIADLKKVKGL